MTEPKKLSADDIEDLIKDAAGCGCCSNGTGEAIEKITYFVSHQASRIAELEAGLGRARERIEASIRSGYFSMAKEYLAADAIENDQDLNRIEELLSPKDTQGEG